MRSNKVDTIVVGAGIAGMLTALRLARAGQDVMIIEKDKIGSGSTISNHGMIHSGALYARQHGHIVQNCQEAQNAFTTLVPDAEVPAENAIYIATKKEVDDFTKRLDRFNFTYSPEKAVNIPELLPGVAQGYEFISMKERVFSSDGILRGVAAQCLAAKVKFLLSTKITKIIIKNERAVGVALETGEVFRASSIVVANGLGLCGLLQTLNSFYCKFLSSRLDMMVHLPKARMSRGLIFADLDKPILMPAKDNTALGSFFGGVQPKINGDRKFSVDFEKAQILMNMTRKYFDNEIVNTQDAVFYMCGKTDYTGTRNTEKGFINPGFQVIDHAVNDNIKGLYSIVTGKMTLAFHASQKAADSILVDASSLVLNKVQSVSIPDDFFSVAPWASAEKI